MYDFKLEPYNKLNNLQKTLPNCGKERIIKKFINKNRKMHFMNDDELFLFIIQTIKLNGLEEAIKYIIILALRKIKKVNVARFATDITVERCLYLICVIDYHLELTNKYNLMCCIEIIKIMFLKRALHDAILEYLTFTTDEDVLHLKTYIVNCKRIEIFDTEEIFTKIFKKYGIDLRNLKHLYFQNALTSMKINVKEALRILNYDKDFR